MSQYIPVFASQGQPGSGDQDDVIQPGLAELQRTAPQASFETQDTITGLSELMPAHKWTVGIDQRGKHQITVHSPAARSVKNDRAAYTVVHPDGTLEYREDLDLGF